MSNNKKVIGKTLEGDNIVELGWKNFAEVEKTGEIVTKDGLEYGLSPYLHLKEIMITHRHYTTDAYIDLNSVYCNGHHITSDDGLVEYIDGTPFVYLEIGDEDEIYEDKKVMKLLKKIYGEDFDIEDLIKEFEDNWAVIKYADVVCLVAEPMEDHYLTNSSDENNRFGEIFLSIYKARSFAELDQASFVNMDEVDQLVSLKKLEEERAEPQNIKRTEIARLLQIDKDTLYKLDAKVKKNKCSKNKKKLNDYIDLYLCRKYLTPVQ